MITMNTSNKKTTGALAGVVIAISMVANAVMAQQEFLGSGA
jgi:hypothetical protein